MTAPPREPTPKMLDAARAYCPESKWPGSLLIKGIFMVMYDAAPAPSADAAQPAEPPATDDLVERLRNKGDYERSLHIDRYAAADLIERQAREIERWRNVTARADPDDCAAGIKELYGRWKDAEAERDALRECVRAIVTAYDGYRRRGVAPAPVEYADVVTAIDAARAKVRT